MNLGSGLQTLLLGAEVDVLPHGGDDFQGTGVICAAWLLQPGQEPVTVPCYSVLFPNGAIATVIPPERFRVVKTAPLPLLHLLNRDADA